MVHSCFHGKSENFQPFKHPLLLSLERSPSNPYFTLIQLILSFSSNFLLIRNCIEFAAWNDLDPERQIKNRFLVCLIFSLEKISQQLDISPRQLRHQLNLAGTSLQRIINQYRKSLSKQLLSQTDETIAEIVYLTGFSEPSTFYRAFKRWEGITPIEYRQLNNNNV